MVCADGEEELAEQLARPLRDAGYDVAHNGTISVGESLVGEAQRALTSNSPIVLCATVKAAGSAWAHQVVNVAHRDGPVRVFVVQMEKQAFVKQLAMDGKVARYCDDPARAVDDLLGALGKHFPPMTSAEFGPMTDEPRPSWRQPLDQPTESKIFDTEALQRFRRELRKEITDRYPAVLTEWEFLQRAGLLVGDMLTGTGALLFARDPTLAFPAAVIKCVRYRGSDRSADRERETFEGNVPSQIVAARDFVADRVQIGESLSSHQAQSVIVYDYAMIAVREIIANALVHRDYSVKDSCVHVRLFVDRLEVSSPGRWLGRDLSADIEYDLAELTGQSIKRNFRLAHILSWARLVEGEGSGIPSALRACQEDHSPTPTVREEQGFVTVILHKRPRPTPVEAGTLSIDEFLASYRRHVIDVFGKLQPPDFERRRRMPLDATYVSPTITAANSNPARIIDIWEFAKEIDRAVLLGDPGGGKTTACHVLMHRHATDDQRRIPFLVTLREFSAKEPPERSVVEHIEYSLETFYQLPAPVGAVEQLLLAGKALLIFDGLDELLETSRRRDVSARIERFCAEFPLTSVLVTSRRIGYDQARLDDHYQFSEYWLGGFAESQVKEFVNKWFAQESDARPGDADAFLSESESVRDLRSNPLLLSLMCILYRGEGSLPSNRAEIYQQCANLLFRRWDSQRRIHQDLRAGHLVEPALRYLAWWLFTREDAHSAVTERELVKTTTEFFHGRGFESADEANNAAREFIEFCRGRMWVFSETGTTAAGEKLYSFTHRTFLEYFAASQLAFESDSPEELARRLVLKIDDSKWETVAEISINIKADTSTDGARRVIAALLEIGDHGTEEERIKILSFARKCAATVDLPLSIMQRLA